jgi:hypothetical protein
MFEAKTTPGFFAVPPTSRLRWLVRLRWLALLGVAVGLGVAQAARFAWVSAGPIAIALAVGGPLQPGIFGAAAQVGAQRSAGAAGDCRRCWLCLWADGRRR